MTALGAQGATILVVDDSEIVLELTRSALAEAGYRVVTHRRAEGTVGVVLREKPDLILLDVNMPRLSGDMLASALAVANPDRDTIVLLHSTLPPDVLAAKARAAGAHGYLQKSNDTVKLLATVQDWLKQAPSGVIRAASAQQHPPPPESELPTVPRATRPASGPPRLLVVDDDVNVLMGLRRDLSLPDFEIELAPAPEQALERILGARAPDVVLTDVLMPRLTGIDLYRRAVQRDPSFASRFVFMTGSLSVGFVAEFLRQVDAEVLTKPLERERVQSAVRRAAEGRTEPKSLKRAES